MRPETAHCLARAREDVADARTIAAAGIARIAARTAYYAAFHAAEAFVFEVTGRTSKTHTGLRAEFARVSRGDARVDPSFLTLLARSYKYKELADYGIGHAVPISADEVRALIDQAADMVRQVEAALTA